MRTLPAPLAILTQAEVTSFATCWLVQLTDATVMGFTDHDADILMAGVTYKAASGFTASAVDTSGALNVDNLELEGMLSAPSITEADLSTGRWDYASIRISLVNWANPAQGAIVQRVGRLGEVSGGGTQFKAEIRGLMQALQQNIGEMYQPSCRADFGDSRCKFDVLTVTVTCTLTSVSADGRTLSAAEIVAALGAYDGGKVHWLTGANAGRDAEIKTGGAGSVVLQVPMPFPPLPGDTFNAVQGCLKRRSEDCRDRWHNVLNFRGEPDLPGLNRMARGA
jgi:uncharacterized phage protein (TIGR02218 family)